MMLVIRADAGPQIGAGHVVRSAALATALVARGWQATFAATAGAAASVKAASGGMPVLSLHGLAEDEAAELAAAMPGGCDLLLVDHYGRGDGFERACRGWARRVAVIDDLPTRPHACDVLVDPTAGRDRAAYGGLVPPDTDVLTGAMYAPVRPAFAAARWRMAADGLAGSGLATRIFVSFGATDPANGCGLALAALEGLEADAPIHIDVALTGLAEHLDDVRQRAAVSRHEVRLLIDSPDYVAAMAAADIAIGGGGSSAWERCILGKPTVAIPIADNQRDVVQALAVAGAAIVLPSLDGRALCAAVAALVHDRPRRRAMAEAAIRLCDGLGVARVALALGSPARTSQGAAITLRPMADDDAQIMLSWQRDPSTRRHARDPSIPTEAEHAHWFGRKRSDPASIIHILEVEGSPAGVLRLEHRPHLDGFEVYIVVASAWRGQGVGDAALGFARDLLPDQDLHAYILPDNAASRRLFMAAGYRPQADCWYVQPAHPQPQAERRHA